MEELLDLLDETGEENDLAVRLSAESGTGFPAETGMEETEETERWGLPDGTGAALAEAGRSPKKEENRAASAQKNETAEGLIGTLLDELADPFETTEAYRSTVMGGSLAVSQAQEGTWDARTGGSGSAEQLSGRLTQGRLRVLERESSRVTVRLRENASAGTAPGVRDLDRAFRRDARRYDGGLTLL